MKAQTTIRALLAASALAVPLSAQQLIDIPDAAWANDVTPDGQVVVGDSSLGGSYIWRWRVDPAPTHVPGGSVVAVSDDGLTMFGNLFGVGGVSQQAAVWTESSGWVPIPGISVCGSTTSAYALSGDGTTAVGLAWKDVCDAVAFRWTLATGTVDMDSLGNGSNRASAISRDGSRIGGFAQGSFDRTPATWLSDGTGMLYNIDELGEINGFNNDGSLAVGEFNQLAFIDEGVSFNVLGKLNGNGWTGIAQDISEDANTVPGFDVNGFQREAWIWKGEDGIISVADRATGLGIVHNLTPMVSRSVSDDSNIVVGGHLGDGTVFGTGGFLLEFSTALKSASDSISLSAGGAQTLDINFRPAHAGDVYWVFGSATGTSPGINVGGPIIPLNFDGYFNLTLTRPFAAIFGNFVGTLDNNGEASATLNIPAASDPTLAGLQLHHAVTVSDTLGTIDEVSNAVLVTLGS